MSNPASESSPVIPAEAPRPEGAPARKSSYAQILHSSALIGGSSVLTIGISVIRTKAMAVLLGPAGFGLTGLYLSILDLARSLAAMGINTSGVRQIAAAAGSGDDERVARTAVVLRRTALILGLLGAAGLAVLSGPIARFTFGGDEYHSGVLLLSAAVLLYTVAGGWDALVQGMRRIPDLARIGVYGALLGVASSIAIIYFLRERGVALALAAVGASSFLCSWWYARKIEIRPVRLTAPEFRAESAALLKLGLVFLASALFMLGGAYAIRTIILRHFDLDAAGFYQSAWALGGMYVGIVLQAMGADFYPRLTAAAADNAECNRLVNEQTQVSMLLAGPGVLGTLTFAPLVIAIFYSAKFGAAVEPLRWICLGMALRVVIWPAGFIIVAKGRQVMLFWTELLAAAVHVGLAWFLVPRFGVSGAGMAFLGLYLVHGVVVYGLVRGMTGFKWTGANRHVGLVVLVLLATVFAGFKFLPPFWATVVGVLALCFNVGFSIHRLCHLLPPEQLPGGVLRVLTRLRIIRPPAEPRGKA